MAIVDMDKITLVGLESQKKQILKFLMKKEIVQIDDTSNLTEDENLKGLLQTDGDEEAVSDYEQRIVNLTHAINLLSSVSKAKKPLFAKPRQSKKLKAVEAEEIYSFALEVNSLQKRIIELKADESSFHTQIEIMTPWDAFTIPLDNLETKYTKMILGTIPSKVSLEEVEVKLVQTAPESTIGLINSDKALVLSAFMVAHKDVYDSALETVKEFGFSPVTFNDAHGTPAEIIKNYTNLIAKSEKERADIETEISKRAQRLPELEALYDYFNMEKEQANILSNLVKTKTTFSFNGWVPTKDAEAIKKEITEKFDCCVYLEHGDKKEGIPILLKNSALVEPFETVTSMYSLPHSSNIDPNFMVAIFYTIFFGMMLSDAGYGIIMTLICGFVSFKYKPEGTMGKMMKMFTICGISTTIWGFIFGSIFGGLIPFTGLLDPLTDVMAIMGISIVFGIIHIFVGLGMKAYMLIRDGNFLSAIWDVVSWYLFVLGLVILISPVVVTFEVPQTVLTAGKFMTIAGVILLILTQGRDKEGLFAKAFGGVKSLYDITGYFGDILSYLRLMALCLSTGVISMVINLLGDMAPPLFAIIIGLIGHTVNLLINALGAYVHTSRLQYVEFFGKFYEGGGKAFSPFKLNSKYVIFKEEK